MYVYYEGDVYCIMHNMNMLPYIYMHMVLMFVHECFRGNWTHMCMCSMNEMHITRNMNWTVQYMCVVFPHSTCVYLCACV